VRRTSWGVAGAGVALFLGYVAWEWYLSPVARVRRTLEGAAEAAEKVDADAFVSLVASGYSDFHHPDRESLEKNLRESFARVDRLNVTLSSVDVAVDEDEAVARFDVVVVAVRGEERYVVLGTPFEPEKLQGRLQREDGVWKIRAVARAGGE
jgi:hypothetical protein